MILTTHAVVGAAIGTLLPGSPVLSAASGFISHFVLDAFPHWDYTLSSTKGMEGNKLQGDFIMGRNFIFDLLKIVLDAFVGILLVVLFFDIGGTPQEFLYSSVLWGALGAMLPDALQFVYYKLKREPLTSLQKFHIAIHSKRNFSKYTIIGPALQVAICVLVIVISRTFL